MTNCNQSVLFNQAALTAENALKLERAETIKNLNALLDKNFDDPLMAEMLDKS